MTRLRFGVLALLAVFAADAQQAKKAAWEWTVDERLAGRADGAAAHERVVANREKWKAPPVSAMSAGTSSQPYDVVLGAQHPELFLTYELFDNMAGQAFSDDSRMRIVYRETIERQRAAAGLPKDWLDRLEGLSASYLRSSKRVYDGERDIASQELMCRDRFAAMTAARREFGPAFDHFLYSAVAPDMFIFAISKPETDSLRRIEEGCQ